MRGQENIRANPADGAPPTEHGGRTLHVAVVYGSNEVRYVTAAATRAALAARLADYVRRHAGNQLWPGDARRLRRLLAARRFEAAVEHYFASVGGRWDEERLVVEAVDMGSRTDAAPIPVVERHPDGDASAVQG
ncbi:MAG TPA: hypothetical protein VF591_07125 [Pyrinomonadaceae bacterium]|jgi:hypothetical protein